jgi:hypothetical protein
MVKNLTVFFFYGLRVVVMGFSKYCMVTNMRNQLFFHKLFLVNGTFFWYDSLMAILNSGTSQFDEGRKKEDMRANGCQETDNGGINACCTE